MSGMASFLAGFGGGYLKADRQAKEDERQAKLDKITTDRADREKADWEKKDNYEKGLAAAGAPVAAEQPNDVLMDDDGNATPAVPAFRTTDGKRFPTMAEATAATEKANTPEAINARQAAFMQANGKPLEALQMNNAVMDSKLKKLGLSREEAKFADDEFNRKLTKDIDAHPDWTVGAAKILTDTQVGGLNGLTVSARPSKDGKTVEFVGVGQDGAEKVLKSFKNGPEGKAEFLQTAGRTSFENKVNFVVEKAKADQTQSNWQQTFDFNKKKEENDQQYKSRVLGFQAAQDKRAAETHKIAMDSEKVPAAVKLQAASLADEMKSVSSAMNKAMAEGSFDPNSANAKALLERQALLGVQYRKLLEPHMPGGKEKGAAPADPLGLDKPAPGAAAPQTAAAPKPTPTAPVASMQQVAPAMAPKAPTVLEALNPGGNASLAAVVQPKAQAIESLAVQLKQEQAAMAQVAGANPQAAIAQAQKVQGIRNAINKQLEGMNPEQAALVIQAAGI